MTNYSSFNSNTWLKNCSEIFKQLYKQKSITLIDVKKILDVFIHDTRWIHELRLVKCKYAIYIKLDELIQKHKNKKKYVKYFNEVKLQLECAEKRLVYIKTHTYIEEFEEFEEFERFYGESETKEFEEFERFYGESETKEFETLYGDSKNVEYTTLKNKECETKSETKEFETLYGDNENVEYTTLKNKECETKSETKEFETLYEENVEYTTLKNKECEIKEINLSILTQPCISIANICPIVCRL